ncbi:MAG: formyltetrahydrofolate deformylase [Candidatus Gracilibacteria bacterium]|nr:formyltetrahydrofolate deformylase [Candidatus Gracilibacteria bacterium]
MRTANIIITCPDGPGIIRSVTDFLFVHGGNISFLEEHNEDHQFFMRVQWELENFNLSSEKEFLDSFDPILKKFDMEISLDFDNNKKRLGLFCSREGHCLLDILSRQLLGELEVEIPYVASNSPDMKELVEKLGFTFYHIPTEKGSDEHEKGFLEIIRKHPTDVIGLARYMKILSHDFIEKADQKIINVHHSFLPSFVGAKPYNEAHERGVKLIGATSHYVIPELDQGPIIEQQVKRVKHSHDIDHLKLIGRECEKEVFAFAIRKHIENKLVVYKNRTIVFE